MKFWKKIAAYMPMLSTAFVIACVAISLHGYVATVYAVQVPETGQTADNAKKDEKETETPETEQQLAKGVFDMDDGTYEGSGTGFNGTIKVAVEIKDHTITAVHILSTQDDEAFFNRAKGVIDKIISGQSLDVDVVSGATYSSRGIISAVKNALTGEIDSNQPAASESSTGVGCASVSQVEETGTWKDGTYYGSGTGFAGTLKVKVVIQDGKITSIEITETSDGSSYINSALAVISRIISAQSTNVDTVSGATYSSVGIINAVRDALSDAAVSGSDNENKDEQQPTITGTIPYVEGIYYGTGEGYLGDVTVAVVIQNQTITNILVTDTVDDEAFFDQAKAVIDAVLKKQSIDVDTVSGATFSSNGILEAISKALKAADEATNGKTPDTDEPDVTGTIPYKNGIYFGIGEGYLGDVEICIVIQDNTIKAILVTETEDDEAYFNKAKGVIDAVMKKQTTDVDTISGATYSSNGILEAINEALRAADEATNGGGSDEPDKPDKPDKPDEPDEPATVYVDGDYYGTAVCVPDEDEDFDAYNLSVKITVENDKIVAVTDISGDGDTSNDSYIKRAANGTSKLAGVAAQIVSKGIPENIDTVSRATCSSKSIVEACIQALESARR